MGFIERADAFLLKNYRVLTVGLIAIIFVMSTYLPLWTYEHFKVDSVTEINYPTIVNGILTATSIVFGFVAFELREMKSHVIEKILLSLPLLLFLMFSLEAYFIATISGRINDVLVLIVTSNCLFNILYLAPVVIVNETHKEIESKSAPKV